MLMMFVKTTTVRTLPPLGDAYRSHDSKHGYWFVAQQQLTSHNGDATRGLNIAANATFHDKDTNFVDNYQSLMFVYKGPFDARPKDDVGIGAARIHVNDDVKKNAELVNASNGVTDYDNPRSRHCVTPSTTTRSTTASTSPTG